MTISHEILLKYAPPNEGSVYVDHEGCSAGRDNKKRLWIVRNKDGSIRGFCHHCGEKGGAAGKSRGAPVVPKTPLPLIPGADLTWDHTRWPPEARGWLLKYHFRGPGLGVAYDPETGRLVLPIANFEGELYAQQLRALHGEHPKYLTRGHPNEGHWTDEGETDDCKTVVIVEDFLSAERCRHAGWRAVALLRTTMSGPIAADVVNNFTTALIWMDPDDAGRKAALSIQKMMTPLMDRACLIINTPKQPKEYTFLEAREILNGSGTAATYS